MAMVPWSGPWSVKTVAFLSALLWASFPKQFHCRLPPPWLSKLYSVRLKLQHDYIPESWLTLQKRISKNVKILHCYNTNRTRHYCWTTQLNTFLWEKKLQAEPLLWMDNNDCNVRHLNAIVNCQRWLVNCRSDAIVNRRCPVPWFSEHHHCQPNPNKASVFLLQNKRWMILILGPV